MTKHDEGRRAFLLGTALGAGAAAGGALVPEAFAKEHARPHAATTHAMEPMPEPVMAGMGTRHGAFFNDDDWRRPNEKARIEFIQKKLVEIGQAMGAAKVWLGPLGPGAPGAHHQGGTRMGADPKESVVNKYSQSWDIPNLFVMGSSTHPTMSGFNPTLTIQALAYLTADAIVNRYRKNPGPLA